MSINHKNFAVNLAKKAGKIMLANFKLGMKKQWKWDNTPVTVTDTKINDMVIEEVKKQFPDHGVLGEEASYNQIGKKFLWVCDPVDGTVPFSHGIPTFVFSLALVLDGKPILGVIYDVMGKRMYVAQKGKGAFVNGKRIRVNKLGLDRGVIGWTNLGMTEMRKNFPKIPFICLWCVCYEGMLVAQGELNACFYGHINAHDIAALKVIVEEAGGKVTDRNGKEQRYDRPINGALVSNGVVHQKLLKFTKNS